MQIINCTPHAINILHGEAELDPRTRSWKIIGEPFSIQTITPSGICPRCKQTEVEKSLVNGIPVISVEYGEIENLPEPKEDTYLIVSALVASAGKQRGRNDLLIPARLVRDENGRIIGCLALAGV